MPRRDSKPTSLHVNRIRAAGKIAPLLSWQTLRELPWFFRIIFLLIGLIALGFVVALALMPLIGFFGALLS